MLSVRSPRRKQMHRAKAYFNVEIECGVENIVAKKAHLLGLRDGNFQAFHGQRILCTDINEAMVGTYRICGAMPSRTL